MSNFDNPIRSANEDIYTIDDYGNPLREDRVIGEQKIFNPRPIESDDHAIGEQKKFNLHPVESDDHEIGEQEEFHGAGVSSAQIKRASSSSSSSSEEEDGIGERRKKKGIKEKIMEKLSGGHNTIASPQLNDGAHEKKSLMAKIKDKVQGTHSR